MRGRTLTAIALGVLLGVAAGVGGFTFVYARGYSYLTDDPRACVNCHVMNEQYDGWVKSSHREVAACNDCHTPPGVVGKYAVKARNGFWHSFYFTTGTFPEPIQITPHNRAVTQQACRKCHQSIVEAIEPHAAAPARLATRRRAQGELDCIRCHRDVGHLH